MCLCTDRKKQLPPVRREWCRWSKAWEQGSASLPYSHTHTIAEMTQPRSLGAPWSYVPWETLSGISKAGNPIPHITLGTNLPKGLRGRWKHGLRRVQSLGQRPAWAWGRRPCGPALDNENINDFWETLCTHWDFNLKAQISFSPKQLASPATYFFLIVISDVKHLS